MRNATKYGKDVEPHILDYIGDRTSYTYKVAIGKDKLALTKNSILSRDTPLGVVQTAKVIEVYNEKNTKYTFKVTDPSNTNSIINLVVVDMGYEITEYFIQYIFDDPNNLPYTPSGGIDMARFSGAMFFYDSTGIQIGSYLMSDGDLVSFTWRTDPCPETETEENPTDDDGSNPTGGSPGSVENNPTDDGTYFGGSDDEPYVGGNGNGGGGELENTDGEGCNVGVVWCCSNGMESPHNDGDRPNCNGNTLGNGSWWIRTCDGGTFNPNAGAGRFASDCKGEAGVITDMDTSTTALAECLGAEVNNLSPRNAIAMNTFLEEEGGCSPEITAIFLEFIEITDELPEAKFERYNELMELLEDDPWALLQDCIQQNGLDTEKYLELYNLPFPQECTNRLNNSIGVGPHQSIIDGNVPLANIDYYSVEVTQHPDFNDDGNPDSEAEMYQAFRDNFIDLGSGELEEFQFSCDVPGNPSDTGNINWDFVPATPQDGIDFVSNNPITSILMIEAGADDLVPTIAADDGAVIVTHFNPNEWTIATIYTDNNGTQPFSGNRQWGWLINQNGNFEFFTRAVDVANISKLLNVISLGGANTECQQDTYYNVAEATWENMQEEISEWINSPESHGGQANVIPKTAVRVDRNKIIEILTSNETINEINCD